MRERSARLAAAAMLAAATLPVPRAWAQDPYADAPPYLKPVAPATRLWPVLTVGQQIPLTGEASAERFRFVGIPDGLGLYREDRQLVLLVNHEFRQVNGGPAGPLTSGARVSELRLEPLRQRGRSLLAARSGKYAIERVFEGDAPVEVVPGTRRISRFCSAFLATRKVGFDRPILLHGEESGSPDTFDSLGGLVFATFEGNAYALPRLGRASWENVVAAPFTGPKTVLFGLEDGPSGGDALNSQLYMYVGEKKPLASDALSINGLNNGKLYVFAGDVTALNSEASVATRGQRITGHWVELDWDVDDLQHDADSKAAGAFAFVRIEDGAADPVKPGLFYFDTTGQGGTVNPFGRLYRMQFDPQDPTGPATLTLILDGSEGIVSPDNIDVNKHGEIAILEDPNYNLSTLGLTRDSSVWVFDTQTGSLARLAEIDRASARAHALAADSANASVASTDLPGGWETSGIIDAEDLLGRGWWVLDVQAHSLRIAPVSETVEGGQILLLNWKPEDGQ